MNGDGQHGHAPRRRTVLIALAAGLISGPTVLAACSTGGSSSNDGPDPLIALADAARSDAALAAAAIAADASLKARLEPVRAARTAHAAALDNALGRPTPSATAAAPTTAASGRTTAPGVTQVHSAVEASAKAAANLAMTLPAAQVGLVASIAACCTAYLSVL